jgi:hypothetical protein
VAVHPGSLQPLDTSEDIFDGIGPEGVEEPAPFNEVESELVDSALADIALHRNPGDMLLDQCPVIRGDPPFVERPGERVLGILGFDVVKFDTGPVGRTAARLA